MTIPVHSDIRKPSGQYLLIITAASFGRVLSVRCRCTVKPGTRPGRRVNRLSVGEFVLHTSKKKRELRYSQGSDWLRQTGISITSLSFGSFIRHQALASGVTRCVML